MDSWEDADDDYNPITIIKQQTQQLQLQLQQQQQQQEEEEDQTLIEQKEALKQLTNKQQQLSQQQLLQIKKKQEEEEIILQNELKYKKYENETNEEKKLRERKEIEDDDIKLSSELFDSNNSNLNNRSNNQQLSGLSGLNLKNKDDHINFGILSAKKLENSTSFCIAAYLKEVIQRRSETLSAESLNDIAETIKKIQATKKQAEDLNASKNQKSKKQIKAQAKKHEQVFGGAYDEPAEYESYSNMEDDFM